MIIQVIKAKRQASDYGDKELLTQYALPNNHSANL